MMNPMRTITIVSVMLYAALTAACAMAAGNSSPYAAGTTPATPAFITSPGNADSDGSISDVRTNRRRIETYVTSDDDGDTLVIRIRIPVLLNTVALLTVATAIAAAVILRRRRAARRQPTGQPASPTVPAPGTSVQEPPTEQPDTAGTDTATELGPTAGEKMPIATTTGNDTDTDSDNAVTAEPLRSENGDNPADGTQAAATGVHISGNDRHMLRRLDEFIAEHISEVNLTVNDMATAVYMSRSNLFRRLKTIYGITPNEYLRNKRLLYAAELLRQNRYTISDICFMVGFNSPSYFASCFKKYFGTLPKRYVGE